MGPSIPRHYGSVPPAVNGDGFPRTPTALASGPADSTARRSAPDQNPMIRPLPLLAFALLAAPAVGQDTDSFPTIGRVVSLDDRFAECLPDDAKVEVVASGFDWCEGPVWHRSGGRDGGGALLFSEIPSNTVRVWEPRKAVQVFLKPSGYTGLTDYGREPGSNGLLVDPEGFLISCEHGDRRLSRMPLTGPGGKLTLADRFEGKRLNSPNDLCRRSDGTIYFTDPPYGLPKGAEDPSRELDFCGVYRLAADPDGGNGVVSLVTKEMPRPNGIALSPDEKNALRRGLRRQTLDEVSRERGRLDRGGVALLRRGRREDEGVGGRAESGRRRPALGDGAGRRLGLRPGRHATGPDRDRRGVQQRRFRRAGRPRPVRHQRHVPLPGQNEGPRGDSGNSGDRAGAAAAPGSPPRRLDPQFAAAELAADQFALVLHRDANFLFAVRAVGEP